MTDSNNFFPHSCSFFHSISVKRIEKDCTGGQTGTQDRLKRVGEDRLKDRTLQTAFTKIGEETAFTKIGEEEDRLNKNRRGEKTALTETEEIEEDTGLWERNNISRL